MLAKWYLPESLVVVVRGLFVATSVSVTSAPATVPPCASVTTPVTLPVSPCAKAGAALSARKTPTQTASAKKNESLFIWLDPPVNRSGPRNPTLGYRITERRIPGDELKNRMASNRHFRHDCYF